MDTGYIHRLGVYLILTSRCFPIPIFGYRQRRADQRRLMVLDGADGSCAK
jgi:hypothetical protein